MIDKPLWENWLDRLYIAFLFETAILISISLDRSSRIIFAKVLGKSTVSD